MIKKTHNSMRYDQQCINKKLTPLFQKLKSNDAKLKMEKQDAVCCQMIICFIIISFNPLFYNY
jgi:hypothetical protein